MQPAIELRFKYTEEEVVSALRLYMVRSTRLITSFVIMLGLVLLGISMLAAEIAPFVASCLIITGGIYLRIYLSAYLNAPAARFRGDPKFRDENLIRFSDEGIRLQTSQVDSKFHWSVYTRFLETRKFYILVYGEYMVTIVPKRAFESEAQQALFRTMLHNHIVPPARAKQLREHWTEEPGREYELERDYASPKEYVPPAEPPDWR